MRDFTFQRSSRHPFHFHASAYGVSIRLRSNDEALLGEAAGRLPFGAALDVQDTRQAAETFTLLHPHGAGAYRLRRANRTVFRSEERESVLDWLQRELILHAGMHSAERLFVHSGVVGWRGKAILLPGQSFAGKTTLVAELVRAGAIYYSDEYAVVDALGRVHPYPRDLQMRSPGRPEQRAVTVESLSGVAGAEPLGVGIAVFSRYQPGSEWKPRPVSGARAVLEMVRHTLGVRRDPGKALATLARMLDGAAACRSNRGEAALTARMLLESCAWEIPA